MLHIYVINPVHLSFLRVMLRFNSWLPGFISYFISLITSMTCPCTNTKKTCKNPNCTCDICQDCGKCTQPNCPCKECQCCAKQTAYSVSYKQPKTTSFQNSFHPFCNCYVLTPTPFLHPIPSVLQPVPQPLPWACSPSKQQEPIPPSSYSPSSPILVSHVLP